jgi:hypothetical protein
MGYSFPYSFRVSQLYLLPGVGLLLLTLTALLSGKLVFPLFWDEHFEWSLEREDAPKLFWFLMSLYAAGGVTFLALFAQGMLAVD